MPGTMNIVKKTKAGLLGLSLGAAVLALTQCFSPTLPVCSYQCAPEAPLCPDDYECRGDGLCHLKGNQDVCPFDLSSPGDLRSTSSDGGDLQSDGGGG